MIGILPAAGTATRIHGLPKYLLPVGDSYLLARHVQAMKAAGCDDVFVGTNEDNDDLVAAYAGHGLGYWAKSYIADNHETMTQTVLSCWEQELGEMEERAFSIYNNDYDLKPILFGMPDTYFEDPGVYDTLATHMGSADVMLGLFVARPGQHRQGGMCRMDDHLRVTEVIDKPDETNLTLIWGAMAWQPVFWQYMRPEDPHVGYALPRAIAAGLKVHGVMCVGGFWDCGTPERYFELIAHLQRETA